MTTAQPRSSQPGKRHARSRQRDSQPGELRPREKQPGSEQEQRKRSLWPQVSGSQVIGLLYASIWLVFLAMPTVATAVSDAALGWKLLSYSGIVVFGLVYSWLMAWWLSEESRGPTPVKLAVACVALASLGALSLPAAGSWSTVFLPFIAALIIFTTEPLPGVPVGLAVWIVPTAAFFVFIDQEFWMIAGPGFGMLFIIIGRITEHYDARARTAQEQLKQVEERDRIARDVHDVLGHSLTVLSIKAQLARRLMESDVPRAQAELDEIEQLARESLGQVRSTVTRLRAPQLPGELDVARSALEGGGITAEIRTEAEPSDSALLAWALREAVTNVLRHAQASRCVIQLGPHRLCVADDGVGISEPEGNGLRGLRERAAAEGAEVLVGPAYPELTGTSPERPGTQIEVRLQ